jgi:hypothetical protein
MKMTWVQRVLVSVIDLLLQFLDNVFLVADVNTDQEVPIDHIIVLLLQLFNVALSFSTLISPVLCRSLFFFDLLFITLDLILQLLRPALLLGEVCIQAVQPANDDFELFRNCRFISRKLRGLRNSLLTGIK